MLKNILLGIENIFFHLNFFAGALYTRKNMAGTPVSEIIRAIKEEDVDENESESSETNHSRRKKKTEKMSTEQKPITGLIKQFFITGITSVTVITAALNTDQIQLLIPETGKISLIGILIISTIIAGIAVLLGKLL